MPFRIVDGDIGKIKADVLVKIEYSSPNDFDITKYEQPGENKPSKIKYIFHTSKPKWIGGKHNELDVLKEKYQKPLQKAFELKCKNSFSL